MFNFQTCQSLPGDRIRYKMNTEKINTPKKSLRSSLEEALNLVKLCGEGHEASLKSFFDIYSNDIYNFPLKVFHLTEDDASDFYIYAFERLRSGKRFKSFVGKSSFKTWFYSVLRNMLIDWQRTKKEVKIASITKVNKDGKEYNTIEDESDKSLEIQEELIESIDLFNRALYDIKLENRVIFKLSYIYYLNLEKEEIDYILNKTGLLLGELQNKIIQLRENLSEKELGNIKAEEKITALYMNILDLKDLQKKDNYANSSNLPYIDKIQKAIEKKYDQRKKLIDKKKKGHFIVRTPYKEIAELLEISEGGVSVTLLRVLEKMQKNLNLLDY